MTLSTTLPLARFHDFKSSLFSQANSYHVTLAHTESQVNPAFTTGNMPKQLDLCNVAKGTTAEHL